MQTITVDSNDFEEIRQRNYLYVDKTAWLHRLATAEGRKLFFLARPRRFGKSLMISTLKAMFQGRRNLFEGLAVMDTDWDWKKTYPVIHLNMGMCAAADFETFAQNLPICMKTALADIGIKYDGEMTPSANFGSAIDALAAKGKPPVILIDEYDDPVAKALKNPDVAERVRDALSPIYGQMKDRSGKIRFLMITGVSKFTKLS
ncbi:MAG: AAA family ATPase, partial [Kiritimatiellae bacterium]|nr:AAA family ATPase [Kiritimatiellia bacterium]